MVAMAAVATIPEKVLIFVSLAFSDMALRAVISRGKERPTQQRWTIYAGEWFSIHC